MADAGLGWARTIEVRLCTRHAREPLPRVATPHAAVSPGLVTLQYVALLIVGCPDCVLALGDGPTYPFDPAVGTIGPPHRGLDG